MKLILLRSLAWIGILLITGCDSLTSEKATIPATPSIFYTQMFPNGKIAFIHNEKGDSRNQLYVIDADGSDMKDITPDLLLVSEPVWSPDGEYLAFVANAEHGVQIFKIKGDGSGLTQLTFRDQDSYNPSWSVDGTHILFTSSDKEIIDDRGIVSLETYPAEQIYIMGANGSETRRIIGTDTITRSGDFRNDGYIHVQEPITRYAVRNYIVNSNGEFQSQFPEFFTEFSISWSPDCREAQVTSTYLRCKGIEIIYADGSEKSCLKIDGINPPEIFAGGGSWSPDGAYIVFSSNLDGDVDLYTIKLDGTGLMKLTDLTGDEFQAVWSNDPLISYKSNDQ